METPDNISTSITPKTFSEKKQLIFNPLTEDFESPNCTLIKDLEDSFTEQLEVGQDPLNTEGSSPSIISNISFQDEGIAIIRENVSNSYSSSESGSIVSQNSEIISSKDVSHQNTSESIHNKRRESESSIFVIESDVNNKSLTLDKNTKIVDESCTDICIIKNTELDMSNLAKLDLDSSFQVQAISNASMKINSNISSIENKESHIINQKSNFENCQIEQNSLDFEPMDVDMHDDSLVNNEIPIADSKTADSHEENTLCVDNSHIMDYEDFDISMKAVNETVVIEKKDTHDKPNIVEVNQNEVSIQNDLNNKSNIFIDEKLIVPDGQENCNLVLDEKLKIVSDDNKVDNLNTTASFDKSVEITNHINNNEVVTNHVKSGAINENNDMLMKNDTLPIDKVSDAENSHDMSINQNKEEANVSLSTSTNDCSFFTNTLTNIETNTIQVESDSFDQHVENIDKKHDTLNSIEAVDNNVQSTNDVKLNKTVEIPIETMANEEDFTACDANPFQTKSRIMNTPDRNLHSNMNVNNTIIIENSEKVHNHSFENIENLNQINDTISLNEISNTSVNEVKDKESENPQINCNDVILSQNNQSTNNVENMEKVVETIVNNDLCEDTTNKCKTNMVSDKPIIENNEDINIEITNPINNENKLDVKLHDNLNVSIEKISISEDIISSNDEISSSTLKEFSPQQSPANENISDDEDDELNNTIKANVEVNPFVTRCKLANSTERTDSLNDIKTPKRELHTPDRNGNDSRNENNINSVQKPGSPAIDLNQNTPKVSTKKIIRNKNNFTDLKNNTTVTLAGDFITPINKKENIDQSIMQKKLSPMSKSGDLMGLSPVVQLANNLQTNVNIGQPDWLTDNNNSPNLLDDFEEEFKDPNECESSFFLTFFLINKYSFIVYCTAF